MSARNRNDLTHVAAGQGGEPRWREPEQTQALPLPNRSVDILDRLMPIDAPAGDFGRDGFGRQSIFETAPDIGPHIIECEERLLRRAK